MKRSDIMHRKYIMMKILRRCMGVPLLCPMVKIIYKCAISHDVLRYPIKAATEKACAISPRPKGSSCWKLQQCENTYDLSVIIPFYKTERYAKECIDSVLSQICDYRVEVLLINDGSPDGCGEILDGYADRENVVVFHRKNGGVAAAGNAGIEAAHGEYLMFVDSDDVLAEGAIQALMAAAQTHKADIVEGSHQTITVDGKRQKIYPQKEKVSSGGEDLFGYPWGKVLRKDLFRDVCFPEGFWYEDTIMATLIHPKACTTVTIPDLVAYYRMNPKGQTSSGTGNPKSIDTLYVTEDILHTYEILQLPFSDARRRQLVLQLGPYLMHRAGWLNEDSIQALFSIASDVARRNYLLPPRKTGDFFFDELCEALAEGQYQRWKWASQLL